MSAIQAWRICFPVRDSICVKKPHHDSSSSIRLSHFNITPKIRSSAPKSHQNSAPSSPLQSKKLGVVVKVTEKPRLVLKFIWMEKNIGLALDQIIPGHGSIPLSPYYFWPRKDAWEQLKLVLERKPWISQNQVVILLNQATDIINLWQQSGGDLASGNETVDENAEGIVTLK